MVKWEKQFRIRDELNARFPRIRNYIAQNAFRSNYFNGRMAGESVEEAIRSGVAVVRLIIEPNFVPVEL